MDSGVPATLFNAGKAHAARGSVDGRKPLARHALWPSLFVCVFDTSRVGRLADKFRFSYFSRRHKRLGRQFVPAK